MIQHPTERVADALVSAYTHFNASIFNSTLPDCLIHLHRKSKCYGYFAGDRFGEVGGGKKIDEIALNPTHFKDRSVAESLSTLVHEMVHLWQHHHGKISKPGYHNKEWAEYMRDIGLHPSSTGAVGGKETGQKVSHYIIEGGVFDTSCAELLATGYVLPYIELWSENKKVAAKKAASKTKYTCSGCGLNAWAKAGVTIACGECREVMAEA